MCGICGIITEKQYPPQIIKLMTSTMIHRGPDDEGYFIDTPLSMGVRRLSIIDIEGGRQPFVSENGRYCLIFNGEIYNHEELRQELIRRGHKFRSRCDAEAVLHALEEYGEDGISNLRGMFAFALWNKEEKSLLLARDRLGEKPLYYYYHGGVFAFASEIKPLLEVPEIARNLAPDLIAIHQIMTYNFPIGVRTAFKDIQELPPGYFMVWKDGKIRFKQYWEIKIPDDSAISLDEERIAEELFERLREAVKMRLMSDVPLGIFLSGGLDSSIIAGCANSDATELQTFSLAFDEPLWDESDKARSTAEYLKTKHTEIPCEPDLSLLPRVIYCLEQPQRWSGTVGLFQLYQSARKEVKVILSGEGADEIFGGYPHLTEFPLKYSNNTHPLITYLRGLSYLSADSQKKLFNEAFLKSARINADDEVDKTALSDFFIHPSALKGKSAFNMGLYLDIKCRLVKFVTFMLDRLSMANSVEARAPFLDHELAEFVLSIPPSLKVRPPYSKYILRKSALALLSDEIVFRPKQGFIEPADKWMRAQLPPCITNALASSTVKEKGYFNAEVVSEMLEKHRAGGENHGYDLIGVASVHIWDDLFIMGKSLDEVESAS